MVCYFDPKSRFFAHFEFLCTNNMRRARSLSRLPTGAAKGHDANITEVTQNENTIHTCYYFPSARLRFYVRFEVSPRHSSSG
jgi:hypothetical protein